MTRCLSSLALLLSAATVFSQTATAPVGSPAPAAKKQVEISEAERALLAKFNLPPSPPLTPEEELETFKLPPGFRAELVAADPMIGEPVTMAFDSRGRIWVVEMRGYMQNVDGTNEDAPNGRVVILEDTDGDGRMDKETVFLDQLVMPRAIMLRKGGAVIAEPPALYWCPDGDGDDKADEKIVIHPKYAGGGDPEHKPNGLLQALDNWIYNAKSTERFRFRQDGTFLKETTAFRGQWGITQDDWGRIYYNYNSDQLRGDLLPSEYLSRNPNFRGAEGVNTQIARDQRVFPARVTPGVNRGYQAGLLVDGKLAAFTAASGPVIYRGDLFPPEFRGNSFVPEPSANLIKRNVHVEQHGHVMARHAYEKEEFMTSTDERFRPVNLFNGPDGALYVVDMYRGVIQHITYLTPWLRQQYLDRGLDRPVHQGRIWRIVPEGGQRKPLNLPTNTPELIAELSHPNGWRRDHAQRLLVEAGDASSVPELVKLSKTGETPTARLHALWTLEGLEKLDAATALAALADTHEKVRAAAVRLVEPFARKDAAMAQTLLGMANDQSADVLLQLIATLGQISGPEATAAMVPVIERTIENSLARSAVISGLKGRELEFVELLLASSGWAETSPGRHDMLAQLAQCVMEERRPDRIARLLEIAAQTRPAAWQQLALLDGLAGTIPVATPPAGSIPAMQMAELPAKAATGHRKEFKAVALDKEPTALANLATSENLTFQERAGQIAAVITWPGKEQPQTAPGAAPLTASEQKLIADGKVLYTTLCAACHQPNGQGQEGLAPPLANSDWVTGSPDRLSRIVLHGLGGPIEVAGKTYNMDMPGLGTALTDEQVAQILSYIRREWGHEATIVEPAAVARVRSATKDRAASWTAAELKAIK